jgi:SAM-dependent methyltransferase
METIISQFLPAGTGGPGRLVDFGCGNMPYRPLFTGHVKEYLGCDLPGNELADCILERPDILPFEPGSVDIVLSSSVLEHVVDPATYLAECQRVLSPNGLLILSTHGVWRYHPDPLDLWRWTSEGLKRVAEKAGFSVVHFRGLLGPAATGLQLWQDAVLPRFWGPQRLKTLFINLMQRRIQAADRNCSQAERDADASVFVLVAKKPNTAG